MLVDFTLNRQHAQLLMLHDIVTNKNLRYKYYTHPNILSTLVPLLDLYTKPEEHMYHLTVTQHPYVKRQDREAWTTGIKDKMQELGAEYFDSISKAFTRRDTTILFFKYQGVYVTITSRGISNYNELYWYHLGIMLLDRTDNKDFIMRATTAIQNNSYLEFTADEIKLLDDAIHTAKLHTLTDALDSITARPRPTNEIKRVKDTIERYEAEMQHLLKHLRELELLDFSICCKLNEGTDQQDIKGYLNSIRNNILDVQYRASSTNTLTITVSSYMYIPETDKDFFKSSGRRNSGHVLYQFPRIARLLEDVMNQTVRLPIKATYKISVSTSSGDCQITGLSNWKTSEAVYNSNDYVTNQHIDHYQCFTGYKNQMVKAIHDHNIVGLFEILMQCTASISVFDSIVMRSIRDNICNLNSNTIIKIKTSNGWEDIRLEEYYEKTNSESQRDTSETNGDS